MFFVDPSDEGVRRDICPKCQRNIRKCEICHQEFLPSTSLSRDMSTCDQCIRTETGGHLDYSSRSKLQKTIKIERERHLATIAIDPGSEL
jgi:predicted amidophosphoribosyltransferase